MKKSLISLFFLSIVALLPGQMAAQPTGVKLRSMLAQATQNNDPLTVLTLLKVIKEVEGQDVPYDMCQLQTPKTFLFCKKHVGIPRIMMPQLNGKPRPGSQADQLQRDFKGEVDGAAQFKEYLKAKGYSFTPEVIPAVALKATQSEIVGPKVAGMWWRLKLDPNDPFIRSPLFVSQDNYILDGHHRWAAIIGTDFEDGKLGNVLMNVIKINLPIKQLVNEANAFAQEFGIEPAQGVVER